jgi:TRAP transporter 4TM/12TM fusion protein
MLAKLEAAIPAAPHIGAAERQTVAVVVSLLAVAVTALVLHSAYSGSITALVVRSLFFSGIASAGLLLSALRFQAWPVRALLYVLAAVALLPGPYLQQNFFEIISSGGLAAATDKILFLLTIVVLLVLVYLQLGWPLIILSVAALVYAVFGSVIPGRYGHGGYDLGRLTSSLFLSTEGIYGIPMGVAVDYIFLFALFGTFMVKTGTGAVFVDLARALTGRTQGGPAISAVVSSALLGTINGSAVANVVTTGTFTIPLMRRAGFSAVTAGAVEAAASSAGQIIPPIMGAAAFLMAEIIGVPYAQIALAAALPAGLYVLALLVSVRLEAGRLNLARDEGGGLRLLGPVLLRRGYLLLPLIALILLLIQGFTPMRAAVVSLAVGLLLMPWSKETRVGPLGLVAVCVETLIATVPIIAAIAAAGVVIGVLGLTGLGLMLSGMILEIGGSNLWPVLLLTAFVSFVLGMGLPTTAAYLLLAVLVAPALVKMGLPDISAHMFIFYYGLLSAITPPVALAAYAAAGISGADSSATAWEALRLGFVKLVVPFLFVTMPGLLMIGGGGTIFMTAVIAAIGIAGLSVALAGWFGQTLSALMRLGIAVASLIVLAPMPIAFDAQNLLVRVAGVLLLAALLIYELRSRPRAGIAQSQPE